MTVERDDLLPGNATALERALSETSARLLDAPVAAIRAARQGATAPKSLLGHLAWERSVHHPADDEAAMRARIDSAFENHLNYGSPAALEAEIALDTGLSVRVVEAWERPYLEWPDFLVEVVIDPGDPTPDIDGVLMAAVRRKNVRDWPSARVFARQPSGALYAGAATHVSPRVKILPEGGARPAPQLFVGAATRALPRVKIMPQRVQ
jgi:phage tail P2-like protein